MSKPDESLWLGNRRNIVVVLRLIVFSIIYLIILQERALGELPPVFWVATGAFLLSEIVCLFEYKNYFLVQRVLGWIFVFDAALISLLIYLLGVKSGQLFIGYFAVIAIAAISRSVLASFIITFLVSAFYLFSSMNAGNFTWPEFLTRTLFFFGVAIFASYLSQEVSSQREEKERVEKILEHSEEKYLNLLANPLAGIYQSTLDGEFIYANPALADMLGYASPKELMLVKTPDTYANPARRTDFVNLLKKRGSVSSFENELKTKTGQVRYVLTSGKLEGEVISGVIMDITKRKEMEQTLCRNEERYRTIVDNTENLITWVDKDGKFLFVNHAAKHILGLKPEECLGKSAFDFSHPDDKQATIDAFQKWLTSKDGAFYFENRQVSVKGNVTQMSWIIKALRDDKKNVTGFLSVAHDITRRKRAAEALLESQRQIEFILGAAKTELDIIDREFNLRYVDPECVKRSGDWKNRKCYEYYMGRDKPCSNCNAPKVFETKQILESEDALADDKNTYTHVTSIPYQDKSGEWLVAQVNVDITGRKRADINLKDSEARFKTFFENAPIGMSVLNMQGRYVRVNQSFCTTLGYTPEELYNIGYAKLTHPDDLAVSKEAIDLLLSNKAANRTFNKRYFHKNGSLVWAELNTSLLRDAAGQPLYFLVQIKDITAGIKAEQSLKMQSELLDSSTDSIILFDGQGRFIYANRATYETRGYTKEEFLAKSLADLDTPEDARLIPERMKQITKTGRGRFEVGHRCKDGSIIPVESNVSILNMGNKPYFLAVWRDMTERNQVQEQTRRTSDTQAVINTLLNLSLQNIPLESVLNETLDIILSVPWLSHQSRGAIFLVDEKSHKLEMKIQRDIDPFLINECAAVPLGRCLCGKAAMEQKTQFARSVDKAHEITYKGIIPHGHYCVPIHTRDRILGVLNIYLKDGHSYNQKEVDFLETITKTLAGIISRQEIVREKEGVQAQLLQAQKMEAIGFLSGGIAHDFNNILAAVRGYAELSLMDIDTTNPLYENLAHVVSASDRGKNLTNQLLLFSRKKSMNPKACDLNEILGNLLKMLNRLIGENFHIEPQLEKTPWRINAEAGNLEQVIMNLALNARDAMPKGGRITIRTENTVISKEYCAVNIEARPGNFVCLSVVDTGTGMTKEVLSHIFEPFFTTKEQGKGTGLGLPVVYGIVKQHQGWIAVDSKPGGGSVFKIYLPASDETAQSKPATRIISPADFKGQGERILVVEDDVDVRKLVISVLGRMNYQVFPAGSLAEARQVFDREKGEFHMILSDMSLPDGNGLEICDELTARNKNIKIILSSGYPSREESRDVIRQRGLPFIAKPYNLTLLFKTVREVLEQKAE